MSSNKSAENAATNPEKPESLAESLLKNTSKNLANKTLAEAFGEKGEGGGKKKWALSVPKDMVPQVLNGKDDG